MFEDGALWKHHNFGQGIYIDPARDFVGVYFSTKGDTPSYGEDNMPGYLRRAAKHLAGGQAPTSERLPAYRLLPAAGPGGETLRVRDP